MMQPKSEYPDAAWELCKPKLTRIACSNDPYLYDRIINQFEVVTRPRYLPRAMSDGTFKTFCNIFAQDVMLAMGSPLPSATSNDTVSVLSVPTWNGWEECSSNEARTNANLGLPTIVAWHSNGSGSGHIAVVRPSAELTVMIAQAGKENFNLGSVQRGFGNRPVRFWRHS